MVHIQTHEQEIVKRAVRIGSKKGMLVPENDTGSIRLSHDSGPMTRTSSSSRLKDIHLVLGNNIIRNRKTHARPPRPRIEDPTNLLRVQTGINL